MQPPALDFYHLGISPNMLTVLENMKIVTPTPIQHKAIPPALEGQDIVGIAQTGTGKTLAFGIPLIQRLTADSGRGLVLVPTRDLALQVDKVLNGILPHFKMRSAVLIGGVPIEGQLSALKKDPHILIATPGRMIDHIQQTSVDLRSVTVLVLDEADRMLDMGFAPQVERILKTLYPEHQTMLFSATMPADIVKLAAKYMKLPIHIEIAPSGTAAEDVTQELFIVKELDKKSVLLSLLSQYRGSVLVFARTRMRAKRIAGMIRSKEQRVVELHSDRTMGQREQAMEGFKNGRYRVLVATDIASRGIDVSKIELVINYDLPDDIENYVHRIGRTGRAGKAGHAITLATPQQGSEVAEIEKMIRKPIPRGRHAKVHTHEFLEGAEKAAFERAERQARGRRGGSRRPRSGGGRSFKPRRHSR